MKTIILLLSCLLMSNSYATNLFKNGELNDLNALERTHTENTEFIQGWYASTRPNPTYFHAFGSNFVNPRRNDGFIGLQVYKAKTSSKENYSEREFIQGVFTTPLEAGRTYYLSFDLSLHESSKWAVASLGLAFRFSDENELNSQVVQHIKPDIHLNNANVVEHSDWKRYQVRYRAKGGERSIIFGSFGSSRAQLAASQYSIKDGMEYSAFYFVDNFELTASMPEGGCFYQNQTSVAPPDRITLVLDFSSSMRKGNFLEKVETSVTNSVKAAKVLDRIVIIGFANSAKVLYEGPQATLSHDSLQAIIKKCKLSGATNVHEGLKKAFKITEDSIHWKDDQILLISDGEFNVSARLQKLLAENSNKNVNFLHLGSRKAKSNYAEIGIEYVFVDSEGIAESISPFFVASLNAMYCEKTVGAAEPIQYSFILDDSKTSIGKVRNYVAFLKLMRYRMHEESNVHVYRSSTESYAKLFDNRPAFLKDEVITDVIFPRLEMKGGDEWCYATKEILTLRKPEFSKHYIVVVSDLAPNRPECTNMTSGFMDGETSELFVLHCMSDGSYVLYKYSQTDHNYRKVQSEQSDYLGLDEFSLAETGFSRYVKYMLASRGRDNTIAKYRKTHPLFRN